MSAFTSKATGNWSAAGQTTWNEVGTPGSGDTVTISAAHTITVDANTTTGGVTMNGPLTVATGITFTLAGNVTQGNAIFTMAAGSSLVFSTAGANRKWLQGTDWNQANNKIVINGTVGSHCAVSKTGGNSAWFDGGEEGTGAFGNCGGWDVSYCDFSDLGHNTGTWFVRSNDFGAHHRRFLHCTFDNCKTLFAHTYGWQANSNSDFRVEYCRFENAPNGTTNLLYLFGGTGTGVKQCIFNSFGQPVGGGSSVSMGAHAATVDDNYFDSTPAFSGGNWASFERNTIRATSQHHGGGTVRPWKSAIVPFRDLYFLADHVDETNRITGISGVGNPHCLEFFGGGGTIDGIVMEYPHQLLTDGGDGIYGTGDGTFDNTTIQNCIALPSMTDDHSGTNIHSNMNGTLGVKLHHNTAVGRVAQLQFNERDLTGFVQMAETKSNLIAGVDQSTALPVPGWGSAAYDLTAETLNQGDYISVSGTTHNYIYMPIIYTHPTTGLRHDGYRVRWTSAPDATNHTDVTTGPQFADATRNAATWAVHKGAVAAGPTRPALPVSYVDAGWVTWLTWKRAALDAVRDLLMDDPTLGYADLLPWVREGFAPTNPLFEPGVPGGYAAHDAGETIGAVDFDGSSPPPPPAGGTRLFRALAR